MKGLTARQQQIFDMKKPVGEGGRGMGYDAISAELGISYSVVNKTICACHQKLGILDADRRAKTVRAENNMAENIDPDKAAILVDAVTEPEVRGKLRRISEAIKESGLPERFGRALLRRLETRYLSLKTEVRALKTGEILDMIGQKIHLAGQYLDDHAMAEASARDLMLGISALVEKRQLLRGEPTQIVSDLERKRLNELLPLLSAEMQRRGITIEGQVTEKIINAEPANAAA